MYVCLFVVFRPTRELPVKGGNDPCLELMAVEQRWFFSVLRLILHGASVYNGHLRGHVTLTPVAESLSVELSLPVLKLKTIHKCSLPL